MCVCMCMSVCMSVYVCGYVYMYVCMCVWVCVVSHKLLYHYQYHSLIMQSKNLVHISRCPTFICLHSLLYQSHVEPQNCASHYNETCLSMHLKKDQFSPALIRMNVAHSIIGNVQHGDVFYLVDCVRPNQRHPLPLGNQNDVRPFQKAHKPCKATSICNRFFFFKHCCTANCCSSQQSPTSTF